MVLMGSTSTALRSDSFPAGLRVLVVDHDPACLKILHKMLLKCKYEVSTCNSAEEALDVLEKGNDGFDIVISDMNVADMDGFKFLEQVGLKMGIPVIMMSEDGETSRVMKGVEHGACDCLLKPIRMKELRNIWQHVFRKRIHEVRSIEPKQDQPPHNSDAIVIGNKRKDADHDNTNTADPTSLKKPRVVWTIDLHHMFVKAVNRIGLDKVGPKRILDLMGVPWLTRENVASHLQKYRLYMSRMRKENDLKAAPCNGMKLADFPSNSVTLHQNIVINGIHHNHSACEPGIPAMPMQTEPDKLLFGGDVASDPPPPSRMDYNHLLKSESKTQAHYTWSNGDLKPHFQPDHHFPPSTRREADQSIEANFYRKNRSYAIGTDHALLSITQQAHLTHSHAALEPLPRSTWSTNSHDEVQNLHNNLESSMIVETGSAALRLHGNVEHNAYASTSDHIYHLQNPHQFVGFGCSNLVAADHVRPELYDLQNVEDEYDGNAVVECHEANQGLYFG